MPCRALQKKLGADVPCPALQTHQVFPTKQDFTKYYLRSRYSTPAPSIFFGSGHDTLAPSIFFGAGLGTSVPSIFWGAGPAPSIFCEAGHGTPAPSIFRGAGHGSPAPSIFHGAGHGTPAPSIFRDAGHGTPAPSIFRRAGHSTSAPSIFFGAGHEGCNPQHQVFSSEQDMALQQVFPNPPRNARKNALFLGHWCQGPTFKMGPRDIPQIFLFRLRCMVSVELKFHCTDFSATEHCGLGSNIFWVDWYNNQYLLFGLHFCPTDMQPECFVLIMAALELFFITK
ncbi:hypothetical protein DFH08DRAFT_825955 [Mycena albidolilacea]|uniref:Uncharacterized protein n=1 Tax=Mycena albidolilacea TaxID=1033008 RepID=A0AAD7E8V1_9AGAR|nr:hypothetical protein DFH08DRAFT_825955 [Mycena albidolilacea]